ncbi:Cytochrome c1 heme lyase-like protein [Elsinoe fawcettii]|nr:Cytochrome c1 heme lyase-like protein [Elsinoe fawcettii]
MVSTRSSGEEACPVDHKTRQAWLDKARAQQPDQNPPTVGKSCDSSQLSQTTSPAVPRTTTHFSLDQSREVSTIPRAIAESSSGRPANNENESGPSSSGNWIYPSEQMFFDAMKRKSYDPQAQDMRSIVPIHNAVNERAWAEIKGWEAGKGSEKCGGPKLVSFSGQSTALTPRARWNTMLGYTAPFDRHDWVVDRCGQKIDYVIDFYSGKDEGKPGKSLNFYLDVRPKLNTFEGVRMRMSKFLGF